MKPSKHEDVRARLRKQPAPVRYDVERGLARHRQLVQANAPLPDWANQLPTPRRTRWLPRLGWIVGISTVAAVIWLRRAPELITPPVPVGEPAMPPLAAHAGDVTWIPEASHVAPTTVHQVVAEQDTMVEPATPAAKVQPRVDPPPLQPQLAQPVAGLPRHRTNRAHAEAAAPAGKREHGPRSARVETPQDNVELQQLVEAERALPGDPLRALRLAREGELNFRSGYFAQERRYIEVMSLFALGRLGEAHAQAAAFLRDYPGAPYRRKVELEMLRQPQH